MIRKCFVSLVLFVVSVFTYSQDVYLFDDISSMLMIEAKDKPVYKISKESMFEGGLCDIYESSNSFIPKYVVAPQNVYKGAKEGIYEVVDKDGENKWSNLRLKYVLEKSQFATADVDIYDVQRLSDSQHIKMNDKPVYTYLEYIKSPLKGSRSSSDMKHRQSRIEIYDVAKLKGYRVVSERDTPILMVVDDARTQKSKTSTDDNFLAELAELIQKYSSTSYKDEQPKKSENTPIKKGVPEIFKVSELKLGRSIRYDDVPTYSFGAGYMSGDVDKEIYTVSGRARSRYSTPTYVVTSKIQYMLEERVDYEVHEVSQLGNSRSIRFDDIPIYVISSESN